MRIGIKLSFLLLAVISFSSTGSEKNKYEDYKPTLNYGSGYFEIQQQGVPLDLAKSVRAFYELPREIGKDQVYSYVEFAPSHYFALLALDAFAADAKIRERVTNCRYPNKAEGSEQCYWYVLGVINAEENTLVRLDTPQLAEVGTQGLVGGLGMNLGGGYGCYAANATMAADLNLDGEQELIFVGGTGLVMADEVDSTVSLMIYSGTKQILRTKLSEEKYIPDGQSAVYRVTRDKLGYYLEPGGEVGTPENLRPALRSFAKLYFGDFDGNERLDILVWRRNYQSRKKTDIAGFEFVGQEFEWHEEGQGGFVKKSVSAEQIAAVQEKYGLTWKKGFPNKNLCPGIHKDRPLIDDYGVKEFQMHDEVLLR